MTLPDFARFQSDHLAQGFDEVLQRVWQADTVIDTHTHPFAVKALVVAGDLWLTVGSDTRHLRRGDTFELAREEPHGERYGPTGATFWAARRTR